MSTVKIKTNDSSQEIDAVVVVDELGDGIDKKCTSSNARSLVEIENWLKYLTTEIQSMKAFKHQVDEHFTLMARLNNRSEDSITNEGKKSGGQYQSAAASAAGSLLRSFQPQNFRNIEKHHITTAPNHKQSKHIKEQYSAFGKHKKHNATISTIQSANSMSLPLRSFHQSSTPTIMATEVFQLQNEVHKLSTQATEFEIKIKSLQEVLMTSIKTKSCASSQQQRCMMTTRANNLQDATCQESETDITSWEHNYAVSPANIQSEKIGGDIPVQDGITSTSSTNHRRRKFDRSISICRKFLPDFQNNDRKEIIEETRSMPENTYSFLICSEIQSWPFLLGVIVFLLQIVTTCLLAMNLINFAKNARQPIIVPANVDNIVRMAQFIAIIISVLIQDDIRITLEQFLQGYGGISHHSTSRGGGGSSSSSSIGNVFHHSTVEKYWIVCSCQFFEALLVLFASFLLIVNSADIQSVLLNFTAVGFISVLDKVAFQIASAGFFGKSGMKIAKEISDTTFQRPNMHKKQRIGRIFLFVLYCFIALAWGLIVHTQVSGMYLCKQMRVQFADHLAAYSGLYDMHMVPSRHGRVEYIERRSFSYTTADSKNNEKSNKGGRFAFCSDLNSWTFSYNTIDPCDWKAKSSILFEYDLEQTLSTPWKFKDVPESAFDDIRMVCYSDTHYFNPKTSSCPAGTFGLSCQFEAPCPSLSVQGITNFMDWHQEVEVLELNNNDTTEMDSSSSSSVQAYNRPIYVGHRLEDSYSDLVIFTGRRWILTNTAALQTNYNNNNAEIFSGLVNATSRTLIADYFHSENFHASDLPPGSVTLISEAIDDSASSLTPVGLKWFYPQYFNNNDDDDGGLPIPDFNRPADGTLFCGFCNNQTNPCLFEGICQSSDGTCTCMHGTRGMLCEQPPLGDGICNPFFNSEDFNFDGGDCCGATCVDEGNCGISSLTNAFGSNLSVAADGYPGCKDPSMVPITIRIDSVATYFYGLHLICGGITYLRTPYFSIFTNYFDGMEVVYVKEGAECELTLTIERSYAAFNYFPSYLVEIYDQRDMQTALLDGVNMTVDTESNLLGRIEGRVKTFGILETMPFVVMKECLFHQIPNIHLGMLNENTPQGKALRWLNTDTSERSSCRSGGGKNLSVRLQQRYALAVLNFATNDILRNTSTTWLTNAHECDWRPGIRCSTTDDLVTSIHLWDRNLFGYLPSEIGLLPHLVELDLGYNRMSGTIPTTIGNLLHLEKFQAPRNRLNGTVPTEFGKLRNLETIFLALNRISGRIPEEFGAMVNIKQIVFTANALTGGIPSVMYNLVHLTDFLIDANRLTGSISTSIGNLKNLKKFSASSTLLTGVVPSELGYLSKLEVLHANRNQLTGTLPTEIGDLTNLAVFLLSFNQLTGTIPSEIGNLKNTKVIHLGTNLFSGTLPRELRNLISMRKFDISSNDFSGTIPSELGDLRSIEQLIMNRNQLSGFIPKELGNLHQMNYLYLSGNALAGTISEDLCYLDGMDVLAVDCDAVSCPADCNCRGMEENNNNFFSCSPSPNYFFSCEPGFLRFQVKLIKDYSPQETYWDFVLNGKTLLHSDSGQDWACISKDSCGVFTIHDARNNGICCHPAFGFGSYTLFLESEIVAYGGRFTDSESVVIGPPSCTP